MTEHDIYFQLHIIYGIVAFCYCLSMATLLLTLKIWLDVYHNKWFKQLDSIETVLKDDRRR